MLPGDGDHLGGPRVADVATHDLQLRERQRDGVDVGDRPPRLAGTQRARVPDLRAEGHVQLDALDVQRPVVRVRRRPVPQPGHDAQALEALPDDVVLQLLHGADRVQEVDGREPEDPCRVRASVRRDVLVGEDGFPGPSPCRKADLRHARRVHHRDELRRAEARLRQCGIRVALLEEPFDFGELHGLSVLLVSSLCVLSFCFSAFRRRGTRGQGTQRGRESVGAPLSRRMMDVFSCSNSGGSKSSGNWTGRKLGKTWETVGKLTPSKPVGFAHASTIYMIFPRKKPQTPTPIN